jgi:general secretion pathway protein F
MPEYIAKFRKGNKLEQVLLIADNPEDARIQASRQGRVMSIKKSSGLSSLFSRGMNSAERIVFLRRLGTMVRSRLGMGDSLKIMKSAFKGPIARVADELFKKVEAGADFGDAIMTLRKDFPETTAALIRAGIRGGDIYAALEDAARFESEMDRIRRDSSKGIGSAVASFLLAAFIIIGSSLYLAPYVMESDLIQAAGDAVDVDWVFTTADVVAYIMVAVTASFLSLLFLAFVVKPIAPAFADRLILKIPIYRDLVLSQGNYTVFYGMGLLIRSGVRMEDTLRLAKESAPPGEVAEDMGRALNAVRHGKAWPNAMRHLHPTDRAALSTSQDREQVSDSIDAVANQYKESYSSRVQQVVPALKMISALFMTIGGALIFGMIILPMLQMTKGVLM